MASFSTRDGFPDMTTNKNDNSRNQLSAGHSRKRLESLGSVLDLNGEENQYENQSLPPKRRPSSSKQPLAPQKNNSADQENNENASNNATRQDLSQSMMRQHRKRLLASGQVAASILTPQNAALVPEHHALDSFVRKGTRLKSFLDDALQHVATGYAITTGPGTKRLRISDNDAATGEKHENDREQATAKIAKEKTAEVLALQQV